MTIQNKKPGFFKKFFGIKDSSEDITEIKTEDDETIESPKKKKNLLSKKESDKANEKPSEEETCKEKKNGKTEDNINLKETNEDSEKSEEEREEEQEEKEEKERKKEKEKEENKTKPKAEEIRSVIGHLVEPEERKIKNYLNPGFWIKKYDEYKDVREKERQDLGIYEILREGAKPSTEYYILTILSCVIATFGLIQGSSATIIGAMIVAPLMTPMLAFSLGVVWGDISLIRISVVSIGKGILWALIISAVISVTVPLPSFHNEIMSRTAPTLYDILVAIASGLVGAYGYANKKISNSLIGIAIAVALMPPLCVVGIGIGTFNAGIALGAALLFLINLVSIGLAGALVFWWMKIHPIFADQKDVKKRALSQIVISIAVLLIISIPVGIFMYDVYKSGESEKDIGTILEKEFPRLTIFDIKRKKEEGKYFITIILSGDEKPEIEKITNMKKNFIKNHENIRDLKITFLKTEIISP
jgi:uncharacterized hydrophobic protein (TIGR00271 family)